MKIAQCLLAIWLFCQSAYAQPYQRKIVPITLQHDQLEFATNYLQHIVKRWPYTGQQGCCILNISNQPYRQKPARLS